MTCQGFQPATYDLYVLGLLDQNQRAAMDGHVIERCPVCVQGVQRSMRLWLVFASTLQDTEPPANFQARLTEITQLSRNVLTFPKDIKIGDEHRNPRWALVGLAAVLITIAVIGGWHAGWASANLDGQRLGNQVANLNQEVTTLQLQLDEERNRRKHVTAALNSSENASAAGQAARLATELLRTQAEIDQYKWLLERQRNSRDDTTELIEALSLSGVKTVALKGTGPATGYVLLVPPSKLIFMASNLAKLPPGKQYQLWVLHKEPRDPTSAAIFTPSEDGSIFLSIEAPEASADISGFAATDEPLGGSPAPTGTKILIPEAISTK
ncbi:MAG: anti-sigma factor [Acidobacteriota bacterium]|nr:anti-sigma factor [Acidobacteriota bacterium]